MVSAERMVGKAHAAPWPNSMATAGESQVLSGKPPAQLKCSGEFFIILSTTFGECLICSNSKHSSWAKCNVNKAPGESHVNLIFYLQTGWLKTKYLTTF